MASGALRACLAEENLTPASGIGLVHGRENGGLCDRFWLGVEKRLTENRNVVRLTTIRTISGVAAEHNVVAGLESPVKQIHPRIAGLKLQTAGLKSL